jgi:trans-aconitate methyltransferase
MNPATATMTGPDAAAMQPVWTGHPDETIRLWRQAVELRPETLALIDRIGLMPGQSAIDLGCGPRGALDLLCTAVSPGGRVVGLDSDPAHVAMAREYVTQRGLANVEIVQADARHTGLPPDSFDFVHARTLLAILPNAAEVAAEMVRLARPGGWVAAQEPDGRNFLCYPPLPAWDRLGDLFRTSYDWTGADLRIGRKLTEIYRQLGLEEVGVTVLAGTYPVGHARRMLLPDLAHNLRPVILRLGLAGEPELDKLDRAVREHLADPRTVAMLYLLFQAWGRKPW